MSHHVVKFGETACTSVSETLRRSASRAAQSTATLAAGESSTQTTIPKCALREGMASPLGPWVFKGRTSNGIGGGHGGFITAILRAHPSVHGILTELDRAVPGARAHLAANGVADRCDVLSLDFFTDPLPSGAGGYLLAHVIHNWDDERALAILRAARAAIPTDGRLLLVESIIPDDDAPHLAKDLEIRVLTITSGGERTESEYARLLTEAGFRPEPAVPLGPIESLMMGVPGH